MFKIIVVFFICLPLSASPALAADVDPDRLWLPKSYAVHWSSLRAVAEATLAGERCKSLVRGEIARAKSTPDHPVFGITCRDENNRTFLSLYDGLTMVSLDPESEPEDNEEPVNQDPAILEQPIYEYCLSRWQEELVSMKNLAWVDSIENWRANRSEALELDGRTTTHFYYERNFDATDMAGAPLRYTAYCDGETIANASTRIAPRSLN